ncbi:hypothetical protein TNCV_4921061 [Trichonephila clavipes]|uniref:Uncharacterized protein n=1 Tax=Trichonephila clavipes TaxID=2585209 RepID=A0A8X6V5F2_TRICX|nr:hypothetical protein TNCV_4921061 [Trichonephila clavipes]
MFQLSSLNPPSFVCGVGPVTQHCTSITMNDKSGPHKIFQITKCIKIVYNTLPHSSIIRLWRRTGESSQPHHHQDRQLRLLQKIEIKKLISFFYHFPPILPYSSIIGLWRRTEESLQHYHHRDRQLRPDKIFKIKKFNMIPLTFPYYPRSFIHHPFVAQGQRIITAAPSPRSTVPPLTKYSKKKN